VVLGNKITTPTREPTIAPVEDELWSFDGLELAPRGTFVDVSAGVDALGGGGGDGGGAGISSKIRV